MSRLGRYPIKIPSSIKVELDKNTITISGTKGRLTQDIDKVIKPRIEENEIFVDRAADDKNARSKQGLFRSLVENMIIGVTEGFQKELEVVGVGYRANLKGKTIELQVGYSSPYTIKIPDGIEIEIPVPTRIIVKGIDKQQVGEFAAEIRDIKKPEPYKGKGIRYVDEYVRRKVGKTAG